MKKILFISIGFIAAAVVLLAFSVINNEEKKSDTSMIKEVKNEKHSCCAEEKESGEYSENSLYHLESEWMNQSGEDVRLSDFRGKKVVMTMFFASCTYACPILVEDMRRMNKEIPVEKQDDYKLVLISIDHERDTPARLKEFADRQGLDKNKWTLLTGSEESILELAALIGFKYKKESDGQYSHSNIINILNEKGEIEFQHQGLNQDVTVAANYLIN
jgi:protein SCO1